MDPASGSRNQAISTLAPQYQTLRLLRSRLLNLRLQFGNLLLSSFKFSVPFALSGKECFQMPGDNFRIAKPVDGIDGHKWIARATRCAIRWITSSTLCLKVSIEKSQNGDYTIAFVSPLPTSVLIWQFAILDACKAGILAWK